jgi:hypothetical protein
MDSLWTIDRGFLHEINRRNASKPRVAKYEVLSARRTKTLRYRAKKGKHKTLHDKVNESGSILVERLLAGRRLLDRLADDHRRQ